MGIQGESDPYGSVKQLEALEKNVKFKIDKLLIKDCGHDPLSEHFEVCINKIKNFINEIEN